MKRKLVLLNVLLAALIGAEAWQLRVRWLAAQQHEKAVLSRQIPPAPAPPHVASQPAPPVTPAQYIDIANKDLFTKERNPVVIIEKTPPPPPPPMPPLPVVRGVLNLDGVTAIMSENPKAAQKEVRPGETIGEFKLLAINNQEIVLEWNGEKVRRNLQEVLDHSVPEPAPAAPAAANSPALQPQNKPQLTVKSGPGTDMGAGRKACVPGDNSPAGTVVDGMKKVYWDSPFGRGCYWEVPK